MIRVLQYWCHKLSCYRLCGRVARLRNQLEATEKNLARVIDKVTELEAIN